MQRATAPAFVHVENPFSHFDRERLIPQMLSSEGPKMAWADVNGDGVEDVYVCGARDQAGALFYGDRSGGFRLAQSFEQGKASEDRCATFFDADGDGDLDSTWAPVPRKWARNRICSWIASISGKAAAM